MIVQGDFMMSKREIIDAIVRTKKIPERMGLCEDFWPETVKKVWPKRGMPEGVEYEEYFNHDIMDLMQYWKNRRMIECAYLDVEVIDEDEETMVLKDGWRSTVRVWKDKSGTPEHIDFELKTPEIWKKKFRESLLYLNKARFENLGDLKERYDKYTKAGFYTMYNSCFIFENMRYSMGDFVMLQACALEPDWIKDFCEVYTNFTIMHVEYLFNNVGIPDAYTIYDDMAYTKNCFISPQMYKELIVPYTRKFVEFLKSYNVSVFMHSCGYIEPQLPNIIEAGIDCIQPLEAKTGMDIVKLANTYGDKIAFMGNIDVRALETNNKHEIEKEIVAKLKSVKENRIPYIFHTDHSISTLIEIPSYQYALEVFWQNCKY
jgi:uroporphyrinogen decarboxylase